MLGAAIQKHLLELLGVYGSSGDGQGQAKGPGRQEVWEPHLIVGRDSHGSSPCFLSALQLVWVLNLRTKSAQVA